MGVKFFLDDVPPLEFQNTLLVLRPGESLEKDEIITRFDERNLPHHSRFGINTLGRMVDLGVLIKTGRVYTHSPVGESLQVLVSMGSPEFFDYVHYLHLQKAVQTGTREYFWTYWLLCWYLGERDGAWNSQEAASIAMSKLQEKFGVSALAIDKGSLGKLLRWIRPMAHSPVDDGSKSIQWREDAPVRPFLLAIDFYYRLRGLDFGFPLLLTADARTALRRVAFLSEAGLDGLLNLACKVFQGVRLHTSTAGVSLILDRPVSVETLISK